MILNEKFKKYPIKFYRNKQGNIEFESSFIKGTDTDLNSALNSISNNKELEHDLYYYYDDVGDVRIGKFIPAETPRKSKGREYLGQIEVMIDVSKELTGPNTLQYIAKNPEAYNQQQEYIKRLKKLEKIDKFKNKLSQILKSILNRLSFKETYMFTDTIRMLDSLLENCVEPGRKLVRIKLCDNIEPYLRPHVVLRFMYIHQQPDGYYTLQDPIDTFTDMEVINGIFVKHKQDS